VDYGAKDVFKRGWKPQYPRDSEIDNWTNQFEPLCRTKENCIKVFEIYLYGPQDIFKPEYAKILSRIIINHGKFPNTCQMMFLRRKYEYVNKHTSKATRLRGAHQDTHPKYYDFKVNLEGIESRYKYDIFADGEPALTDAQLSDLFTSGCDPVAEYHELREQGEQMLSDGSISHSDLKYGSLVETVRCINVNGKILHDQAGATQNTTAWLPLTAAAGESCPHQDRTTIPERCVLIK
jgi:hypothetical protein